MVGGWTSFSGRFGHGGYYNTPIEEALPVTCMKGMDDRIETPEGVKVKILDTEHPIVKGIPWEECPVFEGFNKIFPKPGAGVLAKKDVLLIRKEHGLKLMQKKNLMPFLAQEDEHGNTYYQPDNATLSFSVVGLSDALVILTGEGLENPSSRKIGHEIMNFINGYAKRLENETGDRWTVLQAPAESTAGRFAMEDRRKYGKRAPVHGATGGYYYTNSTHVDVDTELNLIQKVLAEQNFHSETSGGHIFHGYLGEAWSPDSIRNFTEKLINNSNLGFWTTTSVYSVCPREHILIPSAQFECPQCGTPTEVYDRITGYMQRVSGWNKSKQSEYKDRRRY